jgi:nucleoside-diphosphate-sugar epimerase
MINKMSEIDLVGPLNVGKEERITISEIAETIVDISEKNIKIEYDTTKDTVIWGQWCSCQKAEDLLGWRANTTLKDGIKKVYNDIKNRI